MEWMLMPLRRYADFSGRSRRKEYWMFTLGILLAYLVLGALLIGVAGLRGDGTMGAGGYVLIALLFVLVLGLIIPSIAVQVRRLHDQDRSGWFVLLGFIPYVGGIVLLVFMCLPGTQGPNRFGPDPKGDAYLAETFR